MQDMLEGDRENFAVLDTGAGGSLFRSRIVFSSLEGGKSIRIRGVEGMVEGGKPVARRGRLKENNLFLEGVEVINYPGLSCWALVAVVDMQKVGWHALWFAWLAGEPRKGELFHVESGRSLPMLFREDGLTMVRMDFGSRGQEDDSVVGSKVLEDDRVVGSTLASEVLEEGEVVLEAEKVGDGLICLEVSAFAATKLELHLSSGHMVCPPGFSRLSCPDCSLTMGVRGSHPLVRKAKTSPGKGSPLAQQAGDFYGPLEPASVRGKVIDLVIIDDVSKFCWLWPLTSKALVSSIARSHILAIRARYGRTLSDRVVLFIRWDNEKVLR